MTGTYRFRLSTVTAAVAVTLALGSPGPFAQDSEDELIEEVVTTGTRKEGQSPTETM